MNQFTAKPAPKDTSKPESLADYRDALANLQKAHDASIKQVTRMARQIEHLEGELARRHYPLFPIEQLVPIRKMLRAGNYAAALGDLDVLLDRRLPNWRAAA